MVIKLIELIWLGLLIKLMSNVWGLHHNCILRPHVGSGESVSFTIMNHGGYVGGRT